MRKKPEASVATQIQERIAAYVYRYHDDDWTAFGDAAGLNRATIAGWRSRSKNGGGKHRQPPVPDVVTLLQLRTKLNISLEWLLLGTEPVLYDPTPVSDQVPQRFRAALTHYLGTGGPTVECWIEGSVVHAEQPRAEHFDRVLPEASVVFKLAAEFIRALLPRPLHILVDRERRRGKSRQVIEKRSGRVREKKEAAREAELELDAECELALKEWRISLTALVDYIGKVNRMRRPPFRLLNYDEHGNYSEPWPTSSWGILAPVERSTKK